MKCTLLKYLYLVLLFYVNKYLIDLPTDLLMVLLIIALLLLFLLLKSSGIFCISFFLVLYSFCYTQATAVRLAYPRAKL